MTEAKRRYLSTDGFRDLVRALKDEERTKLDTTAMAVLVRMPTEVRALGKDSGVIEFTITSDKVDREQDTLAADGWMFDNFLSNPVVLWCHDHYGGGGMNPVIGNSRSLTRAGNKWKSLCEFTPADLNPFGWMTYQMYQRGFMHACSVGFQPVEYSYAADRKYGINYIKQELLEYSCVPVPANPDALVVARGMGIDTAPLKVWAEQLLDGKKDLSDEARARMEVLRLASSPSERALIMDMGETMTRSSKAGPKEVKRWDCGTKGHAHDTEAEATSCAELPSAVADFKTIGEEILAIVTAGKALTDDQKKDIREIAEKLAPAPKAAPAVEEDGDKGVLVTEEPAEAQIEIGENELKTLITEAVGQAFEKATGRLGN